MMKRERTEFDKLMETKLKRDTIRQKIVDEASRIIDIVNDPYLRALIIADFDASADLVSAISTYEASK